jgi:hypothetical protein
MHHTPARTPHRPGPREPAPPSPDPLGTIVRGILAVIFGCGGAAIVLVILAVLLGLFLG